ncbi:TspO/MBR family protein [Aquimarina intermedia]|uniref:TspO/MBR related protein n=1 Tax=Aquimarina intermedia TaxID=350814 RepID=A0A5S5CFV9_9FLAO|nr:TspO/MBR family protein [Aquimarina intermedia]TYP77240.1 TspO/MBR related protein [Aquimarina intermedia]
MKKKLIRISITVFICLSIGILSSIATQSGMSSWYPSLVKPAFTPPQWVFGPVWIVLYILMGIAAGMVWSRGFYHKWVKVALYHFGFQLLLNAAWSILFFGLRSPLLALLDITALFILFLFTIKWFKVVNNTAAYLLIPYAIWIAFAAILNYSIWQLN